MTEAAKRQNNFVPAALAVSSTIAMAAILALQGRLWWCKSGDYRIYVNEAWNSSHTSQHFLDPYSFTHVLHGVMFFWLATLLFSRLTPVWRFVIAIGAEALWEILENSNYIIEKYRENTASLDYFGDSVFNSIGDIVACGLGFWIAQKLGWWKSLAFFVVIELILLMTIRDGLLLNIVMLVYPLDAIKNWQMGI